MRVRPLLPREQGQQDIITVSDNMVFAGTQSRYVPGYALQNREKGYAFKGVFARRATTLGIFQETVRAPGLWTRWSRGCPFCCRATI